MRPYLLALVLLLTAAAFAQHDHPAPLPPPGEKLDGMGKVDFPVTTSVPEAQVFVNQGMALAYGFNHDEAARSFRRAADLDPNLAMAYWGIAFVYGANYNLPSMPERETIANAAIKKAQQLAPKASPREQAYIAALSRRYSSDPKADLRQLAEQYSEAMGALSAKYPDDLNAATLYAESMMNLRPWALWNQDGTPAPGTEKTLATLESVIKRDPRHTGANHYYIHAVEASKSPHRALASAMRLAQLAPAAGHLVHMPSHIYYRTGDHEQGAATNLQAAEADRAYMAATKTTTGIYPLMYYSHNIHFESIAHAMAGRHSEAMRAARQLEQHVAPHVKDMPMLETNFLAMPIWTLVRFGKWEDVLKYPRPDAAHHWMTAMWHFSRGMAFARTGKPAEGRKELQAMLALQPQIPNEVVMQNKAHDIFAIAHHMLAGTLAESQRDFSASIQHFQQAVAAQNNLIYIEPPEWPFPMREVLGHGYLAAGKYEEAEKTFRADLDVNPRNGRSLFGLAEALRGQGRAEEAKLVDREFHTAWAAADTKLSRGDAHAARAND